MSRQKNELSSEMLFIVVSFLTILLIWFAVSLVELQIFYKNILMCLISLIFFFAILFFKNKKIKRPSKIDLIALFIVLFFALFNTFHAHETFFGGRDDGVYANTAAYIAKNHTFYVKNPVVSSFPGYVETSKGFMSSFYLGYTSWIATNISFFGIKTAKYSNFILILFGLASLYFVGKKISGGKVALFSLVAFATTYPMFWFTRKTFSENLALFLIWFGILCFLKAYENKEKKYLIPAIVSFNLFLIVRVEAIALFLMLIVLLFFLYFIKKEKWVFSKLLLLIFLVSLFPAIWYNIVINNQYIVSFFNTLKNFLSNLFLRGVTSTTKPEEIEAILNKNILEYNITNLSWQLLSLYNFLLFIFIPIALFKTIRFLREKQSHLVWIIFFLLLPQFFYLFNPSISLDQPWFLRRFLPVILPAGFLFLGYLLKDLSKRVILVISFLLISANLVLASPILTFREFDGALGQIKKIENANIDKKNSLILVDYNNLGHYKIAEPLFYVFDYNSVAVMPFSIKNLLTGSNITGPILYTEGSFKIPSICDYDSIYLLTNKDPQRSLKKELESNSYNLIHIWETNISYMELIKECELFRLTKNKTIPEMAHVNIEEAKEYCNTLPERFEETNITMELLKIDNELTSLIKGENCEDIK